MYRVRSAATILTLATLATACGSSGGASLASFCASYAEFQRFGESDNPDQSDAAQVRASFEGTKSRVDAVRSDAPAEVASDASRLAQQFEDVRTLLEGVDFDLAAVRDDVDAIFEDPENTAARERVSAFNAANCIDGSPKPTPSISTGPSDSSNPRDDAPCAIAFYVGSQWQHFDAPDLDNDAEAWELYVRNMVSNLTATRDAVPDRLRPALDRLVSGFEALHSRWAAADWDPVIVEDMTELEDPSFVDARAEFDAYNRDDCRFGQK